jgi:hypothetical protein
VRRACFAVAQSLVIATTASAATRPLRAVCDFGRPVAERVVLRPQEGTFFSVDVLNPDLVRQGSRYLLFFSGNSANTDAGAWRTGVAFGWRPLGPFRVDPRLHEPFFNGGTVLARGRFFHGANVPDRRGPLLLTSRTGLAWRLLSAMPAPPQPSWRFLQSDLYLRARNRGLDVYFAGRPGPGGADLGVARYDRGHWTGNRRILVRKGERAGEVDLGEPAVFQARNRTYMLYAVQAEYNGPRQIWLAYRSQSGWRRCSAPFIGVRAPAYPANAIDPEPLIVGDRLYVYFGGGQRPGEGGNMAGVIVARVYALR